MIVNHGRADKTPEEFEEYIHGVMRGDKFQHLPAYQKLQFADALRQPHQYALATAEEMREADAVVAELGVPGVKYACDLNGYFGGAPRLPRVGLTAEEKARVEKAFREVRN